MAGRKGLLAEMAEFLGRDAAPPTGPADPDGREPSSFVVLQGPPGSGRGRLVKEYVHEHGARHSLIHVIDASSERSIRTGVARLRSALTEKWDLTPSRGTWNLLADHPGWLLVYEDLPAGRDLREFDALVPWFGRGSVIVTTGSAAGERGNGRSVTLTLGPLTRAEVADYLLAHASPGLLDRDPEAERRLRELAERLPAMPGALSLIDVRQRFARELGLVDQSEPTYQWYRGGSGGSLAGFAADGHAWLASVGERAPVWVRRLSGPAASELSLGGESLVTRHDSVGAAALAAFRDRAGRPLLAVADGSGSVAVRDALTGEERFSLPAAEAAPFRSPRRLAAFTGPDGTDVLVTFGPNTSVRLWNAEGRPLPGLADTLFGVTALTFFRSGADRLCAAVVGRYGNPSVVDAGTGRPLDRPQRGLEPALDDAVSLTTVSVPGLGDVVAVLGRDGGIRLWDAARNERLDRLTAGQSRYTAVAGFTGPEGQPFLAVARDDAWQQVWDLRMLRPHLPEPVIVPAAPEPPTVRTGHTEPPAAAGAPRSPRPELPPDADSSELRWRGADFMWLVAQLADDDKSVSREALSFLAPYDQEWIDGEIDLGALRYPPNGRVAYPPRAFKLAPAPDAVGRCESRLLAILDLVCAEPTADPATWVAYAVLEGGVRALPPLVIRWAPRKALDAIRARRFVTRWIAHLLLRGRYEEAGDLVTKAESSPLFDGTTAQPRLSVAALRVHMARGEVAESGLRCERILAEEPAKSPQTSEAQLVRARVSLLSGELAAARLRLRAAEGVAEADLGFALRLREERVHQRLTGGELSAAAVRLSEVRDLLDVSPRNADVALLAANRLAEGRHALLRAELDLVIDDLANEFFASPREQPASAVGAQGPRVPSGPEAADRPDPSAPVPASRPDTVSRLEAARWRMWQTPSGRPASLEEFLASVPSEHAEVYAALTERYVEALLVRETGGLWRTAGEGPYSAPSSVRRTLDALNERLPTRTWRADLFARRMLVEGRLALAGGSLGRAVSALDSAWAAAKDAYGPASPLLPRIGLTLALARFRRGEPGLAVRGLDDAEDLLLSLYGPAVPHPDRVTALLARSRLAPRQDEARDAARAAAAMRRELLGARPEM